MEVTSLNTNLYSIKGTGEALNVGRTTVCELIADGDIESIKIGRRRLVTPEAIGKFIEKRVAGEPTVGELRRRAKKQQLDDVGITACGPELNLPDGDQDLSGACVRELKTARGGQKMAHIS